MKKRNKNMAISSKTKMLFWITGLFNLVCSFFVLFLLNKEIQSFSFLLPLLLLLFSDAIVVIYICRHNQREKRKEKEELFDMLEILAIFLKQGESLQNSLEKCLSFVNDSLGERIRTLLEKMEIDKTVSPFAWFFACFPISCFDGLCLSLQSLRNGDRKNENLECFSASVIERKKETMKSKEKENAVVFGLFEFFPLFATCMFSLLILAQIANVLRGILHG